MTIPSSNEYTRLMVEKFSELNSILAPTAFQGSFFGVLETGAKTVFAFNTKSIEIDIQKRNKRRLAAMVHRGTGTVDTERVKELVAAKFSNINFAWPLIESEGAINSNELLDRSVGEMPFSPEEQKDRLTKKALEIHNEGMVNQIHTMEFLARESVLTGTHPAILGTTNTGFIYDFFRNTANIITVGNAWNSGSQDINADMDAGIDAIQQNAYLFGSYGMLLGTDAFNAFKKDSVIKGDADNRRYGFVTLDRDTPVPPMFTRYVTNGFQPRGWIDTVKGRKVWIFTYDLTFTDDFTTGSDVEKEWMPLDQALLFSPKTRCDRYFGPNDRLPVTPQEAEWYQQTFGFSMMSPPMPVNIENPAVIDPRMFHVDAYLGADKKSVVSRTQSAVILPTTQTDGFATLKGLVT